MKYNNETFKRVFSTGIIGVCVSYIDDERALALASFVPKNERLKLLEIVFEACGENISRTAKEIKITRAQLYRYLGRAERVDIPSDEILARIIKAAYKLRPVKTRDFFRFLLRQFRVLITRL
ncbi:MAG: hypothetical protein J7J22_03905 [Candidatus Verstraetearchaeota archaeon]|nr:hypothetical protein [Candidatus Verstraetearchaeota archaeon]